MILPPLCRRWPVLPVLAVLALSIVAPARPADAAPAGEVPVSATVRAGIRDGGTAAGLVLLDPNLAGAAAARTLRADLAGTRSHVHRVVPSLHLAEAVLDADGLQRLERSTVVTRVISDPVARAALDESVPYIGADQTTALGFDGDNVAVAIVDNGVAVSHPTFAGRTILEACFAPAGSTCPNGQSTQGNDSNGEAGAAAPCTGDERCIHGTHVAGIAIGAGGGGVSPGVAPKADLLAVQVFDSKGLSASLGSILAGLEWVRSIDAGGRSVGVVNLSLEFAQLQTSAHCDNLSIETETTAAAVKTLLNQGVVTVAAAGNGGAGQGLGSAQGISFPSCLSNVIAVASSDMAPSQASTEQVSAYSNSGPILDLLAPGRSITSAAGTSGAATESGSSMAAPHVSGAVAVLADAYPGSSPTFRREALLRTGIKVVDPDRGTFPRVAVKRSVDGSGMWANNFAAARLLDSDHLSYAGTATATAEANEPAHGPTPASHSVWFHLKPSRSGRLTLSTVGSTFDTVLAVYVGGSLASLARVASSDDIALDNQASQVAIRVAGGVDYRIAIDGKTTLDKGMVRLNDAFTPDAKTHGDSVGVVAGTTWAQRDAVTTGPQDRTFTYGAPGDVFIVGDWDGNGTDTVGVRRGSTFYLRNANSSGPAQLIYSFGVSSDRPIVGDWDGNGTDTIGVRRGNAFYLRNSHSSGPANITLGYGLSSDTPVIGDWNGDGRDTIGVRRGNAYYLRNRNTSGPADLTFAYGSSSDIPVVGDWDGDGDDNPGVRRGNQFLLRSKNSTGPATSTLAFGTGTQIPVVGDWDAY